MYYFRVDNAYLYITHSGGEDYLDLSVDLTFESGVGTPRQCVNITTLVDDFVEAGEFLDLSVTSTIPVTPFSMFTILMESFRKRLERFACPLLDCMHVCPQHKSLGSSKTSTHLMRRWTEEKYVLCSRGGKYRSAVLQLR